MTTKAIPVSGESESNKEFSADNPPADAPIPTMVSPWERFVGSAGFFASRVLSFFVVLDVGGCDDFLFFEAIFARMVTSFYMDGPFSIAICIIHLVCGSNKQRQYMSGFFGEKIWVRHGEWERFLPSSCNRL